MKGFAQQEKDVLLGVTNARAKVGSIQATPDLINDPGGGGYSGSSSSSDGGGFSGGGGSFGGGGASGSW